MANRTGKKGNKGGAGRRNKFGIDWSQFEDFAIKLDELNADVKKVFNDVMEQVGETVQEDTVQATAKAYLPASGKYSQGDTIKAVDTSPKVEWSGTTGRRGADSLSAREIDSLVNVAVSGIPIELEIAVAECLTRRCAILFPKSKKFITEFFVAIRLADFFYEFRVF